MDTEERAPRAGAPYISRLCSKCGFFDDNFRGEDDILLTEWHPWQGEVVYAMVCGSCFYELCVEEDAALGISPDDWEWESI